MFPNQSGNIKTVFLIGRMESSPEIRGTASVKFFRVNVKEKGKIELNEFHFFEFCRKTNLNSSFLHYRFF